MGGEGEGGGGEGDSNGRGGDGDGGVGDGRTAGSRATLQMRTLRISPWKKSPYACFEPMQNGSRRVRWCGPEEAMRPIMLPSTNIRRVDPSNVDMT